MSSLCASVSAVGVLRHCRSRSGNSATGKAATSASSAIQAAGRPADALRYLLHKSAPRRGADAVPILGLRHSQSIGSSALLATR